MRRSLLNKQNLSKSLRQALVLFTMLLLPSAAWGETVTKTIKFNTNDVQNHSVSVTEKIGSRELSYVGKVNIWDSYGQLNGHTFSSSDGAVFTLKDEAVVSKFFAIEIPGTYPAVPSQVTLKVAYANSGSNTETQNAEIRVGDYGDALTGNAATDPVAQNYTENHPYKSNSTSLAETTLTYIGNEQSGLGTNRNEAKSQYIYVYLNGNPSGGSSNRATFTIKEVTMTYDTDVYDLSVAGIPVTGVNTSAVLFDKSDWENPDETGTVSFTPAENSDPATLTLNGAEISYESGNVIVSTLTNPLEVILSGNSNINSGSYLPFEGATGDNANLVFKKLGENPTLVMTSSQNGFSPTSFYTGFNEVSYDGNQLYAYLSGDNVVIERATSYGLTVAGVEVTSANANNITGNNITLASGGKVSFTPASNYDSNDSSTWPTLTLNGATIKGDIVWSNSSIKELIIEIKGKNSVINSESEAAIKATNTVSSCTLSIKRADNADEATLKLATSAEKAISNFDQIIKEAELNMADAKVNNITYDYYTTNTVYGLKIAGTDVHDIEDEPGYKDKILGDNSVMFKPATSTEVPATLTLTGATINGQILWSKDEDLTIEISGLNKVNNASSTEDVAAIKWTGTNAPDLTIKKVEGAESASLILAGYNSTNISNENPITGFANTTSSLTYSYLRAKVTQTPDILYKCYSTEFYDLFMNLPVHNVSEDYLAHCGNIMNYSTPCVTFTKTDDGGVLTFDNATINTGFQTSLPNITVDLKGNNTITQYSGGTFFSGDNDVTPNVTFTTSSDPAGSLTMKVGAGASGSSVFANNVTITYDGGLTSSVDLLTESVTEAFIAKGTFTGLTIAGTLVTSANKSDVLGDGTVSFTPADDTTTPATPATLTLNNASIKGNIKFNSDLTVHLVGDNIITNPKDADTFYAFVFDNTYRELYLSTDETKPGTLKFVELGPVTGGLSKKNYITNSNYNMIDSGTTGDPTWIESSTDETPSYLILSLNKHYNLWKNGHQFHDLNLSDNDGFVFDPDPENPTLTIINSSSSYYINSGLENLTIIVSGSISMSHIAFGAPEDTQAEGITTGTLTITGDSDYDGVNSLSLGNYSSGVITGFSSVDLTLPMHVSEPTPSEFTGWTSNVTEATITDETYDYIFDEALTDGINYVTYYSLDRDLYLSNAYTPSVITEISGSTVKTQALSYIPKKTPVLVTIATNTATTATFTKNELKFVESSENPVTASKDKVLYVLYNNQFVKVTQDTKIYYGGYLDLTGVNLPANTRGLTIDGGGDGTTSLREVRSEGVKGEKSADGEWYTLQGQRVTKPTKPGLYILNGRKVVIK